MFDTVTLKLGHRMLDHALEEILWGPKSQGPVSKSVRVWALYAHVWVYDLRVGEVFTRSSMNRRGLMRGDVTVAGISLCENVWVQEFVCTQ